jgi:hypothetical protein
MTTKRAGILLECIVLQCSKNERNKLFLLNYVTPGIPKEPESEYLRALQGFPEDDFVVFIHPVNLEDRFGNIQPNTCNVHDQPLAVDGNLSFPVWHRRCRWGRGGVHVIRSAIKSCQLFIYTYY